MVLNKDLKKGKYKISSGDVFEVLLSDATKGYFQFLYKDDNYMAGHVIRAYNYKISKDKEPIAEELVSSGIKFIAHTRVFEGLKDGLWIKSIHIPIENNFEPPVFRQTNDNYAYVKKSYNWFIWQYNPENRKVIGELTEEYKNLPMSGIFPSSAIFNWFDKGWHGFLKPE